MSSIKYYHPNSPDATLTGAECEFCGHEVYEAFDGYACPQCEADHYDCPVCDQGFNDTSMHYVPDWGWRCGECDHEVEHAEMVLLLMRGAA